MAVVGSAEVVVRAITTKVQSDIQRAFRDSRPLIEKEGREAGEAYSRGFGETLNRHLTSSLSDAVGNASRDIDRDLTRDLGDAAENAGEVAGNELERALGRGGGRGGRAAGQSFSEIFGKEFSGAIGRLMSFSSVIDLMGPSIANLVAGLSSLVSGLFSVGAAAAQAAGAIAVLPGLFGVLGQIMAVFKLGFSGVGAAVSAGVKAQTTAAAGATAAATKSGAAAARLKKLQEELTKAREEARKAQEALTNAEDKAHDTLVAQAQASDLVGLARQKLNDVLADPSATEAQKKMAREALAEAQGTLSKVNKSREDSIKKLHTAQVKDAAAQKRLKDAEKARNNATKAGGISTPAINAANAYQNALAQLTPEAQAFVKEILKMREAFKEVTNAIQRELFPPLTKALQLIGNSKFFDILKKNLSDTGRLLGNAGLDLAKAFTTTSGMDGFERWLHANNIILADFTRKTRESGKGTGEFKTPLEALASLFGKLATAIQPLTKRFVHWIGDLIVAKDAVTQVGDRTDGLRKFFGRAGDVAAQLGRIFGNLIGIIGGLGKAAKPAGNSLLTSFEEATKKLDEFINTPKQQKVLRKFFTDVARNMRSIGNLITVIGDEFLSLGDNPGPGAMSDALIPAVRHMGDLADKLTTGEVGKALGDLGTAISELMDDFTQTGQTTVFLETLRGVVKVIDLLAKGFNKIPFAGVILGLIAVNRGLGFSAKILGLSKSWDKLKKTLSAPITTPLKKLANKIPGIKFKIPGNQTNEAAAQAAAEGKTVGHALADGIAKGIGEHSVLVIDAIDELVTELLTAIRNRLDIHSPSRVLAKIGEDTAEGFVLGIKEESAAAFRAGEELAASAAAGADAGSLTGAASAAASSAVPDLGLGTLDKSLDKTDKKGGKFSKGLGKIGGSMKGLGGSIKGLSGGLLGLAGGPMGLLLIALPLLIKAFQYLMDKSPGFRKFVDSIKDGLENIWKAIEPVVEAVGVVLLGVFDTVFSWVDSHMPQIKAIFSSVFGAIGKVVSVLFTAIKFYITKIFIPYWKIVFNVIKALLPVFKTIFSAVLKVISTVFSAIKGVWDKVLHPVFDGIKSVISTTFSVVGNIIDGFKNAFSKVGDVLSRVGEGIGSTFTKIKDAAKAPIKWVIDTVWNNGIVALGSHLPIVGGTIAGWKVNTDGWAQGGWTGSGAKHDVAGLVHRDEFVIQKSARRIFERQYPGLLDFINRKGVLPKGHSSGGIVAGRNSTVYPSGTQNISLNLPGYGIGGIVRGAGDIVGDVAGGIVNGVKWAGDKVVDGVKWTAELAKKLWDGINQLIAWSKSLPGLISANMTGGWGQLFVGIPKAVVNKAIEGINSLIPNGIPGVGDNPIGSIFPGVDFMAQGGRVRKGLPYIVGENRPELFVPDSSGKIIPNLNSREAKMSLQSILEQVQATGVRLDLSTQSVSSNNTNNGSRSLTVNITNPVPERPSQSVASAVRNKAISNGWSM